LTRFFWVPAWRHFTIRSGRRDHSRSLRDRIHLSQPGNVGLEKGLVVATHGHSGLT